MRVGPTDAPAIAAAPIASSVNCERANSPTMRPFRMTRIRSLIPMISGRSEEMSSTAMPFPASASIFCRTSAFAPTSMPRVGSSRISSEGSVLSHLPSTTFCWFPPLRAETGVFVEAALMLRSRTLDSTSACSSRLLTNEAVQRCLSRASVRLLPTPRTCTRP